MLFLCSGNSQSERSAHSPRNKLAAARGVFIPYNPANPKQKAGKTHPETRRRIAQEQVNRALRVVHDLESKLNPRKRWTQIDPEWVQAETLVSRRNYQRCLDELERLIVSRMFELTKMNMSQTGSSLIGDTH